MNFQPIPAVDVAYRLFAVLYTTDADCVAYVYRVEGSGRLRKPYSLKYRPAPDLVEYVQRHLGAGDYKFIIRRGRTMVFSGEIALAAPIAEVRETDRQRMKRWVS